MDDGADEDADQGVAFGKPDYFVTVAVADAEAFEAFQMSRLIGLPAVARAVSHLTMTRLEG